MRTPWVWGLLVAGAFGSATSFHGQACSAEGGQPVPERAGVFVFDGTWSGSNPAQKFVLSLGPHKYWLGLAGTGDVDLAVCRAGFTAVQHACVSSLAGPAEFCGLPVLQCINLPCDSSLRGPGEFVVYVLTCSGAGCVELPSVSYAGLVRPCAYDQAVVCL